MKIVSVKKTEIQYIKFSHLIPFTSLLFKMPYLLNLLIPLELGW